MVRSYFIAEKGDEGAIEVRTISSEQNILIPEGEFFVHDCPRNSVYDRQAKRWKPNEIIYFLDIKDIKEKKNEMLLYDVSEMRMVDIFWIFWIFWISNLGTSVFQVRSRQRDGSSRCSLGPPLEPPVLWPDQHRIQRYGRRKRLQVIHSDPVPTSTQQDSLFVLFSL